jgi:hypothetical protein
MEGMYQWMNAGPGPLDLATPGAEGFRAGIAMAGQQTALAAQQEEVRSNYAKEANMSDMLGLDQKKQDLAQTMWDAGSDMRLKDLQLKGIETQAAAQAFGNTSDDLGVLAGDQTAMHTMTPEEKLNFNGGDYKTVEGYNKFLDFKKGQTSDVISQNQKRLDDLHSQAVAQLQGTQLEDMNYAKENNMSPSLDQGGNVDYGALHQRVIADQNTKAVNLEQAKGAVSPQVQSMGLAVSGRQSVADTKANASMDNAEIRSATQRQVNAATQMHFYINNSQPVPAGVMKEYDDSNAALSQAKLGGQGGAPGQPSGAAGTTAPTKVSQEGAASDAVGKYIPPSINTQASQSVPTPPSAVLSTPPPSAPANAWWGRVKDNSAADYNWFKTKYGT